jgi:hypothetical protein
MDPEVPSGDDPNQGLDYDVGVALHEWTTRWSEIEDAKRDDSELALPVAVDLLEEMYRELDIPTKGAAEPHTEDMPLRLAEVRDVGDRIQAGLDVTAEELDDAWASASDVLAYLTRDVDPS